MFDKKDSAVDLVRENADESIFAPIPKVPTSRSGLTSSETAKLVGLWPRRADTISEKINKFWAIQERYNWKEIWAIGNYNKMVCMLNTFTCYYIGGIFRKTFKLTQGGIVAFNVLAPCILGSVS